MRRQGAPGDASVLKDVPAKHGRQDVTAIVGAISMIMFGCCANVVFLELLVKRDPRSGHLITFAQFLFIALEGLFQHTDGFGFKKRVIPISYYMLQVLIYWVQSTINNKVFSFHIAMPLHMIFRASSLVASMTLGWIFLKKRYTMTSVLSVLGVTVGIALATLASSKTAEVRTEGEYFWWTVGIILLAAGVFMAAALGIVQEWTYSRFAKCPSENMFYIHSLSLPFFALVGGEIYQHALHYTDISEPSKLDWLGIPVPVMWVFLLGNVCTQWLCSKGVFTLIAKTGRTNSLTCTLVITLRKFVSLLFSIWYFNNSFTPQHWVGTALVFIGTWFYTRDESVSKSKRT